MEKEHQKFETTSEEDIDPGFAYIKELDNSDNNNASNRLKLINSFARDIVTSLTIDEIVLTVHTNLCRIMEGVRIALGVYNIKDSTLDFHGIGGCNQSLGTGRVSLTAQNVWAVKCFDEGKEIFFNKLPDNAVGKFSGILFNEQQQSNSCVYIPLLFKSRKLGVLTVQSHKNNAFSHIDLQILRTMGYYLAIALENTNNYQEIERQKDEILKVNATLFKHQEHLEGMVEKRTEEIQCQKEALVQQSKKLELLSIVAEKTENAIMIMDPQGNILWINDFFTRIYGYNYREFIRARGSNIRQTSFNPNINENLDRCISTRKPEYYEAPNVAKNKKTKWTHTTLTPVLDDNGRIKNLVAIDSDITDRKEKEQEVLKYSREVTESIQYAWRIQNAMLPPVDYLNELLPNHFVLFEPKGIVSGDFYWAAMIEKQIVIAVADCTGHGVPGAFMSMLGVSLLNEITGKQTIKTAADVLNSLRKHVKQTLHQNNTTSQTKDGMDISLCIINPERTQMQFAGAYQRLVIANSTGTKIIKGDRMPIGVHPKEKETFTNHVIECNPGDKYYMFTDGYTSMFGGKNKKKYKLTQLLDLINKVNYIPVDKQKEHFVSEMRNWLGHNEHVDDTLLIGFNIE